MPGLVRGLIRALVGLAIGTSLLAVAQTDTGEPMPPLLDRLEGRWVLSGRIGARQTTHDVDAVWVLKHGYLRLHEVSRETDAAGAPQYEAIVFLGWDARSGEYRCMWLDNTSSAGLVPQGIARGKPLPDAVPFVFTLSSRESLQTTFRYDAGSDAWQLTIDETTDGRSNRFADVRLTRSASKP
ncbi:MAG TPA: hypothetical protein VMU47_10545 [Caldimonas sp.]|nr:hypothetical protein [Caldimonas sp.]